MTSNLETEVLAELRKLNAKVDALGSPREALKRREAARVMGVSLSKLEKLIKRGVVRTSQDSHLVPMSEVRRYCAPKVKRERKPAVGHRQRSRAAADDESVDDMLKRLRRERRSS